jgi:hypothetical protein
MLPPDRTFSVKVPELAMKIETVDKSPPIALAAPRHKEDRTKQHPPSV